MAAPITFHDGCWYCYANATAMLLNAHGHHVSPRSVEVLSGVGLGAFIAGDGLPFFSGLAGAPDQGITQALEILGFDVAEQFREAATPAPLDLLEQALRVSPVVIGPLDMSFLAYNPARPTRRGVDHYVLACRLEGEHVVVYDPAGYAEVTLDGAALAEAWRAEAIGYRRGHYRSWSHPVRVAAPADDAIVDAAWRCFRARYGEASRLAAQDTASSTSMPSPGSRIRRGQARLARPNRGTSVISRCRSASNGRSISPVSSKPRVHPLPASSDSRRRCSAPASPA